MCGVYLQFCVIYISAQLPCRHTVGERYVADLDKERGRLWYTQSHTQHKQAGIVIIANIPEYLNLKIMK